MSTSGSLLTEISKLKPGDHLCCIYETEEEHRALLTPFMRQEMKVVYMPGYTTHSIGDQEIPDSAAFLQKPFSIDSLTRKIREVLDSGA